MFMETQMVLIRRYKLRRAGTNGHLITIPEEYISDAKIEENNALPCIEKMTG